LFFKPQYLPLLIPFIALTAFAVRGARHWVVAFWVAIVLCLAMTSVDLPSVSIPRVHLPMVILLLPLVALGLRAMERWKWATPGALSAVLIWSFATWPGLMQPTHGDYEDDLLRRAAQIASSEKYPCVALVNANDRPVSPRTPRYTPDYLFEGKHIFGLDEVSSNLAKCGGRMLVVLGTRCYAAHRNEEDPVPTEAVKLQACRTVEKENQLRSLEPPQRIPNTTELALTIYPQTLWLDVGLYEATAKVQ
jgi:hypothetical protein